MSYQTAVGMKGKAVDGVVGPKTLSKLGIEIEPRKFLHIQRVLSDRYITLGKLYINLGDNATQSWHQICYTYELPDKGNKQDKSCIPKGNYTLHEVTHEGNADRYGDRKGWRLQLGDVKNRTLVQIHRANNGIGSLGCILPIDLSTYKILTDAHTEEKSSVDQLGEKEALAKTYKDGKGNSGSAALSSTSMAYMHTIKSYFDSVGFSKLIPPEVTINSQLPTNSLSYKWPYWNDYAF